MGGVSLLLLSLFCLRCLGLCVGLLKRVSSPHVKCQAAAGLSYHQDLNIKRCCSVKWTNLQVGDQAGLQSLLELQGGKLKEVTGRTSRSGLLGQDLPWGQTYSGWFLTLVLAKSQ